MAGTADHAVFSVFRRASEVPLYRIEKNPKLTPGQKGGMIERLRLEAEQQ